MSTYFVGKILDPNEFCIRSGFERIINGLLGTFAKDFIPRPYPHITIIYIGNGLNKLNKIKNDVNLKNKLKEFIDKKCVFTKLGFYGKTLVYTFEFEDKELNNKMNELMEQYNPGENDVHGENRLHIAFGKFTNNKAKEWFEQHLLLDIEKLITGTYKGEYSNEFGDLYDICKLHEFKFNDFDIVEVSEDKIYSFDETFC